MGYKSGREEEKDRVRRNAKDTNHNTSSVKHGGGSIMTEACMAASGTGSVKAATG